MAEKLEMMSSDIIKENIDYIAKKFPNALKEVIEDGKIVKKIDFDVLKQELSTVVIDDRQERYQMTWPDKKKSILLANSRINGTLRPIKEKSVDFENTKNLYIEGDNLDVLKLLRETYLGKIKMIYIDPPYNTGNDFVYEDDFAQSAEEYLPNSGQYDNQGNKLVQNTDSNGRFHTDWLNMMFPRLKIAKDLLSEDGLIFISIDDNEDANLKKMCYEIFGYDNYIGEFSWEKHRAPKNDNKYITVNHEYILLFSKNKSLASIKKRPRSEENIKGFVNPDNDTRGPWTSGPLLAPTFTKNTVFPIINPHGKEVYPPKGKCWSFNREGIEKLKLDNRIWFGEDGNNVPRIKRFLSELPSGIGVTSIINHDDFGGNQRSANQLSKLFDGKKIFNYSKPVDLMKFFIDRIDFQDFIVLDFFSGSATTAHAAMELNSEDGGKRRFIMVQLPEKIDEKSEAYSAGYKNINEIGQERIVRAGKLLKEQSGILGQGLDVGFRVLKLDSSNMNDVFYNPANLSQNLLDQLVGNIKEDRTPLDLLFQVMLELGIELSAKIEEKEVLGKKYFIVNENFLVACFDNGISDELVTELAKIKPVYAVFKDSSFESDSANINSEQIFKTIYPSTKIRVI